MACQPQRPWSQSGSCGSDAWVQQLLQCLFALQLSCKLHLRQVTGDCSLVPPCHPLNPTEANPLLSCCAAAAQPSQSRTQRVQSMSSVLEWLRRVEAGPQPPSEGPCGMLDQGLRLLMLAACGRLHAPPPPMLPPCPRQPPSAPFISRWLLPQNPHTHPPTHNPHPPTHAQAAPRS